MSPTPGSYSKVTEERQAPMSVASAAGSIWQDASKTRVPVSLALIIGLAYGAFYLGRQSPDPATVAAQAVLNEKIATAMVEQARAMRDMADSLKELKASDALKAEKLTTLVNNSEFQNSFYKAGKVP